jgi:hypothetical protein
MPDEKLEQTFPVSGQARLRLKNVSGNVTVLPGKDGEIFVSAVKRSDCRRAEDTRVVLSQDSDGTVRAEVLYERGFFGFASNPCSVDFEVQAPVQCDASISVVSSDVRIEGLAGATSITTVSGEIEATGLTGEMKLESVSGRVQGRNLTGPLNLREVSGSAYFKECRFPTVKGRTVSGSIELDLVPETGPYEFSTVSGMVELTLPGEAGCSVQLRTTSGRIRTSDGNIAAHRGVSRVDLFGGGPRIEMSSVSGDVRLNYPASTGAVTEWNVAQPFERRRPDAPTPPVPPAPPMQAAAEADPLADLPVSEILDKIERGEMSVEEALKYLNP